MIDFDREPEICPSWWRIVVDLDGQPYLVKSEAQDCDFEIAVGYNVERNPVPQLIHFRANKHKET